MKISAFYISFVLLVFIVACNSNDHKFESSWFAAHSEFISDGFDHPIAPPDGSGYYNAQGFGENNHLGDDWNGTGGGNTDLGDPIYAIANGQVYMASDLKGGWGNVIRIVHAIPNGGSMTYVESFYAHCDSIMVEEGFGVRRGDQIGTIGDAHGKYLAHLHFEIRDKVGMAIGPGYSKDQEGYLNPSEFLEEH